MFMLQPACLAFAISSLAFYAAIFMGLFVTGDYCNCLFHSQVLASCSYDDTINLYKEDDDDW